MRARGPQERPLSEAIAVTVLLALSAAAWAEWSAIRPKFSSEGQWVVAAGTLLHVPSGDVRVIDPAATVALFAPNRDVIVGRNDGSLARYCRQ